MTMIPRMRGFDSGTGMTRPGAPAPRRKADDMIADHSPYAADVLSGTLFERQPCRTDASGEPGLTTIRLREALARDEALLRQKNELILKLLTEREDARNRLAGLTVRQRQITELVLAGHPSKNIAADLGISQRTVENHRAAIMRKTGSKSLPALARLAMSATSNEEDESLV